MRPWKGREGDEKMRERERERDARCEIQRGSYRDREKTVRDNETIDRRRAIERRLLGLLGVYVTRENVSFI